MTKPDLRLMTGLTPIRADGLGHGVGESGGPGDNGGMNRLEHLEKRVSDIDDRLGRIETSLVALEGGLAAKVEALRGDIHKSIAENNKWTHTATVGMFSAFILGVLGLLFTIWNASKPQAVAAPPQQPPIIFTLPPSSPITPAITAPPTPAQNSQPTVPTK